MSNSGDATENQNQAQTDLIYQHQQMANQLEQLSERLKNAEAVLADLRQQLKISLGNLGNSSRNDYKISLLLIVPTRTDENAGVDEIHYCDDSATARKKQDEIYKRRDQHKRRVVILQPFQDSRNFSEFK